VVKLERDLKAGCSVGDRVDLSGFGKVGLKEQKTSKDTEEEFVRGKKKLKGEKKNSERLNYEGSTQSCALPHRSRGLVSVTFP
jgi:hypothetical protein